MIDGGLQGGFFLDALASLALLIRQVCLFQPKNQLKIKEKLILLKIHIKPQGSSAVDDFYKGRPTGPNRRRLNNVKKNRPFGPVGCP